MTLQGINALYADLDAKGIKDYAGPLLPYCWEQKYLESKYRLVIFGQETNGWYCDYMNSEEEKLLKIVVGYQTWVKRIFCHLCIKNFAKIIYNTENFSNFVLGNHREIL